MKSTNELVNKWAPVLEGIKSQEVAKVTAQLLENQAKAFLSEKMKLDEETLNPGGGTTTVGKLGTFQKWAFPMIRRVYPELIFNKIGGTQAMDGPVGQVFYMGHSRAYGATVQTIYSQYKLTYRGLTASSIGSTSAGPGSATSWGVGATGSLSPSQNAGVFDLSNVLGATHGSPSSTFGGQIASWPDANTTLGWSVSAGELLSQSGIPEITMHIQNQTVQARTRKMRALWTIEAAQDLKAYHNIDMENELTQLLSKELSLEIDRELVEDIRMIAYGFGATSPGSIGGWYLNSLINGTANSFPEIGGNGPGQSGGTNFTPGAFTYQSPVAAGLGTAESGVNTNNVYVYDIKMDAASFAPQHLGQRYSNLLAVINFASTDIYKTTFRGPGTVLITSPIVGSMLESAAKLEGGLQEKDGPSNMDGKSIKYAGKFAGKYDLIIDPMFPDDEIIVGYNGASNMDTGFVYCPYIPLMPLPTITDPDNFQPKKGILTRYGKLAIQPANRFYRVIRLVGVTPDFLTNNIFQQRATSIGWTVGT